MSNIGNRFMNRLFRKVGGLVWDLSTGQIGMQTNDGILTLDIPAEADGEFGIVANPFDAFGMKVPAFATNTPLSAVEVGDIIVGAEKILGWVINVNQRSLDLKTPQGTTTKGYAPPKVAVLGGAADGVLVVKSLFSLVGGTGGLAGLQSNPMLLLAMTSGNDQSLEKILPLLLLSQTGAATAADAGAGAPAAANPMASMLPLLLMSGQGGDLFGGEGGGLKKMLPLLMMTGGLGGGAGGLNAMLPLLLMGEGGLGDLFGGDAEPVQLQAPTRAPALIGRQYGGAPALTRL